MANHKQAIKRHRQSQKRNARNGHYMGSARTFIKRARLALAEGDVAEARPAVRRAAAFLDRVASKGIIPGRRADRLKSRLMRQLAALG